MATQSPNRIALCDLSERVLSYQQLDETAGNVARVLVAKGAMHGSIVPICIQKSLNTLVAIFGVWKAGAATAFTPLDSKNPKDRNDFIIGDVGASLAITDGIQKDVFKGFDGDVINMDHPGSLTMSSDYQKPRKSSWKTLLILYTPAAPQDCRRGADIAWRRGCVDRGYDRGMQCQPGLAYSIVPELQLNTW